MKRPHGPEVRGKWQVRRPEAEAPVYPTHCLMRKLAMLTSTKYITLNDKQEWQGVNQNNSGDQ